ncbi:ricin-type beta-trefoil lectin protein [Kribbella sp. VKM Ac-2571]|uniref:RICIN domain-containing protein n=1 Tax=Kribbella sp. VKM Ac-2571 TaxID=2512222 RepID=UPI00105C4D25|nr:RICIN domain-containing protein [Kribbella sp. VKM Ac-2571]TDO56633.1 ricin-type beta-trefoil lectin protein [Kribbella sp. VKM Ac-2571]
MRTRVAVRTRKAAAIAATVAVAMVSLLVPAGEAQAAKEAVQAIPRAYDLNILNSESNQFLSLGSGADNGMPVIQWSWDGGRDQYWNIWKQVDAPGEADDRYLIVNDWSGKCAGISGGAMYNGAPAIQWDCNHDAWANYWFVRSETNAAGLTVYRLKNVWSGKCLAIAGGNPTVGAQAIQWDCISDPDQQWHLLLG